MRYFLMALFLFGCETISQTKNMAEFAKESTEHLQEDLQKPITQEQIDMFVRVTPELIAYQKEKNKNFEIPKDASDLTKLATSIAGLADFVSFFEVRETRITEYYVMAVKIYDAFALITAKKAQSTSTVDMQKKLDEMKALPTEGLSESELAKRKTDIRQGELALEKMKKMKLERNAKKNDQYSISDAEIEQVRKNYDKIEKVLEIKKK